MVGRFCAAYGCTNSDRKVKHLGLGFHRFPLHNPKLLMRWLYNVKRANFFPNKHHMLCSAHFEESQFESKPSKDKTMVKLKKGAVPTIFCFDPHNKCKGKQLTHIFDDFEEALMQYDEDFVGPELPPSQVKTEDIDEVDDDDEVEEEEEEEEENADDPDYVELETSQLVERSSTPCEVETSTPAAILKRVAALEEEVAALKAKVRKLEDNAPNRDAFVINIQRPDS